MQLFYVTLSDIEWGDKSHIGIDVPMLPERWVATVYSANVDTAIDATMLIAHQAIGFYIKDCWGRATTDSKQISFF